MAQSDLVSIIARHAAPLAADLGLGIWGVELVGGARPTARLFVEQADGASPDAAGPNATGPNIDQCAELSRRLGLALDADDLFPGAWTLEVSSPGFERQFFAIAQLSPYVGREIELILAAPLAAWPGRKKFRGMLLAVAGDALTLRLDGSARRPGAAGKPDQDGPGEPVRADVPWDHVRKAHLVHIFTAPEKPGKKKPGPAQASFSDQA
jgi:ribosome maturation factor RimP